MFSRVRKLMHFSFQASWTISDEMYKIEFDIDRLRIGTVYSTIECSISKQELQV